MAPINRLEPTRLFLMIGLPSVAAILFYFYKKRNNVENDFEDENGIKSRSTIIEIRIPADCVRSIIGPQGSVVKEIQRKTDTRINMKDVKPAPNGQRRSNQQQQQAVNEEGETERILLIRGSSSNVQKAELEIRRLLADMPLALNEDYLIPDYACGRIIGRGGATIRELCMMSKCRIKVQDNFGNLNRLANVNIANKRLITITGSVEQIETAKNLILNKIMEEEALRERRFKPSSKRSSQSVKSNSFSAQLLKKVEKSQIKRDCSSSDVTSTSQLDENSSSSSPSIDTLVLPNTVDLEPYLDANRTTSVNVTAIAHPNAFWIQIRADEVVNQLEKLSRDMNEYYELNSAKDYFNNVSELKVGMLVAAKSDRNTWHRAEVKSIEKTSSNRNESTIIDIYYVDYGDSDYAKLKKIRKLCASFHKLACQAIECKLDDIEPVEGFSWSDTANDRFEEIIFSTKDKFFDLTFIVCNDADRKPSVKLFDHEEGKFVSEMLVEKGVAKYKHQIDQPQITPTDSDVVVEVIIENVDKIDQQQTEVDVQLDL